MFYYYFCETISDGGNSLSKVMLIRFPNSKCIVDSKKIEIVNKKEKRSLHFPNLPTLIQGVLNKYKV